MNLEGKIALITGGARGIGAATALRLAQGGADVAIFDCGSRAESAQMQTRIEALGRRCCISAVDVAVPEQISSGVNEAIQALGGVDVLVHCAGGPVNGSLLELPVEQWYRAFDIHVHAPFHLCRAVVPLMQRKKEGAIVLISSAAGRRGCAGAIAYGVVKGAIPQFVRSLARELANDNIRVNCVSPGIIRTRFQDMLTPEQVKNNIENRIPLHREGTAEQVAAVIALLVTHDYITGENVAIDGGLTMRIA